MVALDYPKILDTWSARDMISRTRDPAILEAIINDPSVRPTAQGGDYYLTSVELLNKAENLCYTGNGGAVLFVAIGQGVYQGHIFCVEGSRGAQALLLARHALQVLFDVHRAVKLVADVPMALPAARLLCRRAGMAALRRDNIVEHFELEFETWAA